MGQVDTSYSFRGLALPTQYPSRVWRSSAQLAKLDHGARPEAENLFTLFRIWLRRQFALIGQRENADILAMHLLAWTQGVATLASALRDETFIRREVREMHDWLDVQADWKTNPMPGKRKTH